MMAVHGMDTSTAPTVSNSKWAKCALTFHLHFHKSLSISPEEALLWGHSRSEGLRRSCWIWPSRHEERSQDRWLTSGPLSLAEVYRPRRRRGCEAQVGLKLETLHGSFLLLEDELALTLVHLWSQAGILLLHAEVVFNQVKSLLVDFLVLMALQELDLVQTWRSAPTYTQLIPFLAILHTIMWQKFKRNKLSCRVSNAIIVFITTFHMHAG